MQNTEFKKDNQCFAIGRTKDCNGKPPETYRDFGSRQNYLKENEMRL